MQPSNHHQEAPIVPPASALPPELPAPSEPAVASAGAAAPAHGAKRASAFAFAWNNLRSAGWVKRIADSATVRRVLSTVRKALDDTQAGSQHDDKRQP